jgi:hypothetical protein
MVTAIADDLRAQAAEQAAVAALLLTLVALLDRLIRMIQTWEAARLETLSSAPGTPMARARRRTPGIRLGVRRGTTARAIPAHLPTNLLRTRAPTTATARM